MDQGSEIESGMDARCEVRASVKAVHDWTALTPLILVSLIVAGCVFFINIKTLNAAIAPSNMQQVSQSKDIAATEEELEAARGIEALFIGQMIDGMRKTVPENEYVEKSQAERIYQGLLDNEYSRVLSESGNFGIAQQVLAEIKGKR